MFKDKLILSIVLASVVLFAGGAWLASRMLSSNSPAVDTNSEDQKQLIQIVADDNSKGNKDAAVVLIEYLDLECSACGTYYHLMKELETEFAQDILIVYRHFPLQGHRNAMNASLAAEAASKQGKYFEMHNLLFEKQAEWGGKEFSERGLFDTYATQIGLNLEQFKADIDSKEVRDRVTRDIESGKKLGVNSTPTFFLAGEKIPNPRSADDFRTLIQAALLTTPTTEELTLGEKTHEHIDLKVYLSGQMLDLTQAKYQSSEQNELDSNVHLHDGNGQIVHKHRQGVTLGLFFKSLGITFDSNCFVLDTGASYCSDDTNELKFFVNGERSQQFNSYELNDLDRVLISYGPRNESVEQQIQSVSDQACIYSEKCPERGAAPTENCVGGLGTDC